VSFRSTDLQFYWKQGDRLYIYSISRGARFPPTTVAVNLTDRDYFCALSEMSVG